MKRVLNYALRGLAALLLVTGGAAAQETPPAGGQATSVEAETQASAATAAPPEATPVTAEPEPGTPTPAPATPGASKEPPADAVEGAAQGSDEAPPGEPVVEEAEPQKTELLPAWLQNITIGAGAILYYYQPTEGGAANFSLFHARLVLDGKWGNFGLHIEPRIRDTRLRPFYEGPAWVQEAYGSFTLAPVTLKLGKIYKRSAGLFWDNSFYGNVQVYDGLKLDPNYGASIEGSVGDQVGVDFAAQFFVVDGRTNVSLQGRDTISIPDARRRNTVAGRVEPFFKFGGAEVRIGLGGEHFDADIPGQQEGVTRLGADAKFTYALNELAALGLWGEYVHQDGRHVVDHPGAGSASGNNHYILGGAEFSFWKFTARYNVSHAIYTDADTTEWLHVPGLAFRAHDNITLLAEYVVWRQTTAGTEIPYDTSLNVTLNGHF